MKTRNVERHYAKDYLKRAEECAKAMNNSFNEEEWNACVINAIHSAIAAADAFCICKKGLRHAGERHADAIALFVSIEPSDEQIKRIAYKLSRLLDIKTNAEYGERLMTRKNAEEAKENAEKILSFVKERINYVGSG